MSQLDLVLLHPPGVYDFRRKPILHGPVSDLIPSTSVFEMYPIGFASLADYLERAGFRVRIVNLAARMLNEPEFDAGKTIQKLTPAMFGIDLHWLVHAHGSIEVAKLVKQYHPESKVVLGGLSSSYFYKELMNYPEIDYVIRGDSAEEPLRQLMDCVKKGIEPSAVPNLVWRNKEGRVRENPFTHVPTSLDNVMVSHYANIVRSVIRYRDLAGYIPFRNWIDYPITAIFTCRGCTENCVICGGSAAAFRNFFGRQESVVFRSPELVAQDVKQIARFSSGPIFILGDLRQPGEDYANEVLRLLKQAKVKNQFIFELFNPAPPEFLRAMGDACPKFCLQMSPESHDQLVRKAAGKNYSNEDFEQTVGSALEAGCGRMDIFYMIGLPKQTLQSALETTDYCEHLLQKFKGDKRLSLFIGPLAPFLDPGSLGFEQPERYGYHILFRTLEEHRQALLSPIWKYTLNYETDWMDRQQITDATYESILRLTQLKAKYGLITPSAAEVAEQRIMGGREMMKRIDELMAKGNYQEELAQLKPEIDKLNALPVTEKRELALPVGLIKLKFWRALWYLMTRR